MITNEPLTKLASEFPELYNWVKSISRYNKVEDFIIADYKENRMRVKFFTKNHEYRISARLPKDTNEGYLGCVVQVRKPRAGENWQRGNDLPDGKYCEETWLKIMKAIKSIDKKIEVMVDRKIKTMASMEETIQELKKTLTKVKYP